MSRDYTTDYDKNPVWLLYERAVNAFGEEDKNDAASESVELYLAEMVNNPAYQADANVDGEPTPFIAKREKDGQCSIKAAPGTDLHIGDVVSCFNEHWIVTDLYEDKVGMLVGTMLMCNEILRFQNGSQFIHTRKCVIDDGSFSRRTSDGMAYVPVGTYTVYLSIDSDTRFLYIDKRVAFGTAYTQNGELILDVYKIVGIDEKSKNRGVGSHLMTLTVQKDVYNKSTDDLPLGICDAFTGSDNAATPVFSGSCLITGRDFIRIGTTKKYTVEFSDPNGDKRDDVEAEWQFVTPNGVTVTVEGNVLTVSVPLKENLVGQEITLTATDVGGNYGTFEKKVQVIAIG